jgi:hypothetical protein
MRNELEHHLNEALREVALDIRQVEPLDLASDIHRMAYGNLADIVHTAIELHFRPEALVFAYHGEVKLTWFNGPTVSLAMELHAASCDIYFNLTIDALAASVAIQHAALDGGDWPEAEDARRLIQAIAAARVPRRRERRPLHQPRTSFQP